MIVRRMLPEEIDATITVCQYYYDEASETLDLGEWDTNSVIETVRTRNINPHYVWLNAYDGERPVGYISGSFTTAPWNDSIVMANIDMFYMLKSHRGLENFKYLVQAFEEWCAQCDSVLIFVSDMGMAPDRTYKIFDNFGYEGTTSLVKRIN